MAAFSAVPPAVLAQSWREANEPDFRAGSVRLGWRRGALHVFAELEDDDIFNPETRFNEPAFVCGDVFEIFVRPESQTAYYELHVTPANHHFQLRIPSAEAFRAPRADPGIPPEWRIRDPIFESRTQIDHDAKRWRVHARIPAAHIREGGPPQPGERWFVSFSRYDYTRGREAPVLSSTSPHRQLNFHRQEEWRAMRLPDLLSTEDYA